VNIRFTHYLHDDKSSVREMFSDLSQRQGLGLDEEALDELKWNFYEVELDCTLDTETLEVTINSAR
jgi:hypothetical protein